MRAASYSDCHSYCPFSPKLCKTYLTCASRIGWQSPIGARDEATSSENQVVAYACSPSISKHSPPTIYHGQGLACSSHSGSYKSTMSKSKDSVTTQKKNNPRRSRDNEAIPEISKTRESPTGILEMLHSRCSLMQCLA